jgi:hypothetical protein
MAGGQNEGAFSNPLILHSEHKRILGDAIKRGDERAKEAERRGRLQGLWTAAWVGGAGIYAALLIGFNFGVRVVQ